jgi:hypothetical protein
MWFGEFDPDDKGLYQRVCLWLTDQYDLFLMFKYNWRKDLKLWLAQRRTDRALKRLDTNYPDWRNRK